MSGHAILDSCHHCGAADVSLTLVDSSPTSMSCGHEWDASGTRKHHIHVIVACDPCRQRIWEKEDA